MLMFRSMLLAREHFGWRLMLGSCSFFREWQKLAQAVQQLLELNVAGKQFFDLGTNFSTFFRSLPVSKHVVVVLHCYATSRRS